MTEILLLRQEQAQLAALYERLRQSYACEVEPLHSLMSYPCRMMLGYDKVSALVEFCQIHGQHSVLNLFSGPGGVLKVCSLATKGPLVGIDKLYQTKNGDETLWFDVQRAFQDWRNGLAQMGLNAMCEEPIFLKGDIEKDDFKKIGKFDRIIIDPPFGDASDLLLGQSERRSIELLQAAIDHCTYLLKSRGMAAVCCPRIMLEQVTMPREMILTSLKEIGGAKDIIFASITNG